VRCASASITASVRKRVRSILPRDIAELLNLRDCRSPTAFIELNQSSLSHTVDRRLRRQKRNLTGNGRNRTVRFIKMNRHAPRLLSIPRKWIFWETYNGRVLLTRKRRCSATFVRRKPPDRRAPLSHLIILMSVPTSWSSSPYRAGPMFEGRRIRTAPPPPRLVSTPLAKKDPKVRPFGFVFASVRRLSPIALVCFNCFRKTSKHHACFNFSSDEINQSSFCLLHL
jgi:hypothetical protein